MTDGNRRTLYRVLERQDIYDGMVRVMAAAERGNYEAYPGNYGSDESACEFL